MPASRIISNLAPVSFLIFLVTDLTLTPNINKFDVWKLSWLSSERIRVITLPRRARLEWKRFQRERRSRRRAASADANSERSTRSLAIDEQHRVGAGLTSTLTADPNHPGITRRSLACMMRNFAHAPG